MTAQGISFAEAKALMEAARKAGRRPKVRTFQKNSGKQHCGRAFLLEVVNERTARIQPFHHGGKIETVGLNELRLWKGGNEHIPIEEIRKMSGTVSAIAVPARGTHTDVARFVIYSKKSQGVWGGERTKWTQDFTKAVRYAQHEMNAAQGLESKLKRIPSSDDSVLLNDAVAFGALTELLDELTAPPSQPIPQPTARPQLLVPPPVLELDGDRPPKKVLPKDDFIDFETLFNDNEELLRKAEAERKVFGLEYQRAKTALEDMKDKFELLDRNVVSLGGHSVLKGAVPQPPKTEGKRVFLRAKIRRILLASSRLDNESIHARLLTEVPDVTTTRVSSALSAMRADELVERSDSGGWALTKKGREAEMMGDE